MGKLKNIFSERRVQFVVVLLALALYMIFLRDLNPTTVDLNFGIEFVGGVRIPISLEKSVDAVTMNSIVETLKARINKFGVGQFVVRPLGDKEVIVEVPEADASLIKSVEKILREQGKFEAIVDGKDALNGSDIIPGGVGGAQGERVVPSEEGVQWQLDFAVTRTAAEKFAQAALGKGGFPVYMFLDRPENAVVVATKDELSFGTTFFAEKTVVDALKKEGDDLLLIYAEDWNTKKDEVLRQNRTLAVMSSELWKNAEISAGLQLMGFSLNETTGKKIVLRSSEEITPVFTGTASGRGALVSWKAIGLRSAPILSEGLATGIASQLYQIQGPAAGANQEEQKKNALAEIRELKSIISGGRLPVSTVIGSAYTIAPSLGERFLSYSWMGLLAAIAVVSVIIISRYKKIILIIPIIFINSIEIIVTMAVVGGIGTLDLAAMAGIISMIGTGVNDQIIITDEILRRRSEEEEKEIGRVSMKEKLGRAFYIIFTVAGVAIIAMLPLLLSGIVEIMGFAFSAIVGVLVGVLFTRPAYGVIIKEIFEEKA
jgi:preprotein translocase subunit SecD